MSHSTGAVRFKDGTIKFYEYNGTVDICLPFLYDTMEELKAHWRRSDWIQCNNAEHRHERVEIASTYGNGFYWNGFACLDCNCLISPLDVNYDTEKSGLPDWYPNKELYDKK
jgi:hypothetical protein